MAIEPRGVEIKRLADDLELPQGAGVGRVIARIAGNRLGQGFVRFGNPREHQYGFRAGRLDVVGFINFSDSAFLQTAQRVVGEGFRPSRHRQGASWSPC